MMTRGERLSRDRDYCTIHLCQRKYCRRRHGLAKPPASDRRAVRGNASRPKIPRPERQRLIRQNRDPPIRKSGVPYHPVQTREGVIDMTPIEQTMYRRLEGAGLRPRCQYPVGPFRIDFAFPEARVAVEVDGSRWHEDRQKDQNRDNKLDALGWKVIHIPGSDAVRKSATTILGPIFRALGRTFDHARLYPHRARLFSARHPGRWDKHYSIASYENSKK